jgi:hypothetical protein
MELSLCDFFPPSGTLLDLSDWAFFLSAGKGVLRYSVPKKWLSFPYLTWGVVFTACVVFLFFFFPFIKVGFFSLLHTSVSYLF